MSSTSHPRDIPTHDDWRRAAERALGGRPLSTLTWVTADGIHVPPVPPPGPADRPLPPRDVRSCLSVDVDESAAEVRELGFDVMRVHFEPGEEDAVAAFGGDDVLVDPGSLAGVADALGVASVRVVVGERWAAEDATPAQQIGWALSTLLDAATLADDDIARLVIDVPVGVEVVGEIAKLRALRRAWDTVAAERDVTGALAILASGPAFPMTGVDCETNLVRSTLAGFAALCGGADLIELAPYRGDDEDRLREACRLAANQLHLMRHESRLAFVGDPWAGSDVVALLTTALTEAGLAEFRRLRAAGGYLAADQAGDFDAVDAILAPAFEAEGRRAADLAHRRRTVVGLNRFADPARDRDAVLADDPETSFEFADVDGLDLFLAPGGGLLDFEWLRERMIWHEDKGHARPGVLLLPLGPTRARRARADFAADLFRCGGFAVEDPQGFADVTAALAHARSSDAPVVVVCSDDASYPELVPQLTAALPDRAVYVAGREHEGAGAWGVAGHVFEGVNALAILIAAQDALGIARLP